MINLTIVVIIQKHKQDKGKRKPSLTLCPCKRETDRHSERFGQKIKSLTAKTYKIHRNVNDIEVQERRGC